jgi:16S rRNA processing protein RimM
MSNFVAVAKFGRTYGIKGWIHVYAYENSDLINFTKFYLKKNDQLIPIDLDNIKPHGNNYVAKIKNIENPESARIYTNLELYIDSKDLPSLPEGKYYWDELVGLTIIDQEGKVLGIVDHLVATGANDVLVIIKDQKEHFIPYIKNVVLEVDLTKKIIKVDWNLEYLN